MNGNRCALCPRDCKAIRDGEQGQGFCHMGTLPKVARAALHFWEEPCISGKNGSGTVFFSGCTLRCVYCQNYEISNREYGEIISVERLAAIYRELEEQGAHNINLVNPTHFVPAIVESLRQYRPRIPVVYNSSGYEKVEILRQLEGLVDVYLPDFKYADDETARRYSGVSDYFSQACLAITEMARQTGAPQFNEEGMLLHGTVVRHLILPGNTRNSMAVLDWIQQHLSGQVLVSLMGQYVPCGAVQQMPELNRRITPREYRKVQDYLFSLDLDGFVQRLSSAQKDYIPQFDLQGVLERGPAELDSGNGSAACRRPVTEQREKV